MFHPFTFLRLKERPVIHFWPVRLIFVIALVAVGLLALAGCSKSKSSSTSSGTPAGGGTTVNATLKEWTLSLDKSSATSGKVTFSATNGGTVEHELVVFKTDLAPDALPLSGSSVDEEASGVTMKDEIAEFSPGTTKTLTLNLDPGKYVLICNVPGHYQQGLHAAFSVTVASSNSSGGRY